MKNKLIWIVAILCISWSSSQAQQTIGDHFYGQDAFLFSNWGVTGSARMQGMGGSYSSLGADASNASLNPAGLGFYNRSEISITPFYNSTSNNTTYQGTKNLLSNNNVSLGQASLIIHIDGVGTRQKSSALAITYSKQAYLPTQFDYVGYSSKSSMADYFAERATAIGASSGVLNSMYDGGTGIYNQDSNGNPYGYGQQTAAMAYQAYVIDPTTNNGTNYVRAESVLPSTQHGQFNATGAVSQINISYGTNFDDKIYFGGAVGIASIRYDYNSSHEELFNNGKIFNSFMFTDALSTRGTGINLSLGGIFKTTKSLQFGVSIISPTWYNMAETYLSDLSINARTNALPSGATNYLALNPSDFNYSISSPLRANFGVTYFVGTNGFITADAEYVGYNLMRVSTVGDPIFTSNQKRGIQSTFNDVVNFKIGGEYRYDVFRLRAGFSYRPDPYKISSDGFNHSQTYLTGGVGYRSSNFFMDLAGVFGQSKMAFTPYALSSSTNYSSALINTNTTNIVLSIGTFF